MGRSFKLQSQTKKIIKVKEEEEIKIVYDHRPQIKTNPKLIEEFKKNMSIPSELWEGPDAFNNGDDGPDAFNNGDDASFGDDFAAIQLGAVRTSAEERQAIDAAMIATADSLPLTDIEGNLHWQGDVAPVAR